MNVLLDTNILLDLLLVRQPWHADAAQLWDAHRERRLTAHIAACTLTTVFYIVRRHTDLKRVHDGVTICLETLEIIPVQRSTLEPANSLVGSDFEDKLQVASALEASFDAIVTRDPSGFAGVSVSVVSPAEALASLPPMTS